MGGTASFASPGLGPSTQEAAGVPAVPPQAQQMAGQGPQQNPVTAGPIGNPQRQQDEQTLQQDQSRGSGVDNFSQRHHILGGLIKGLDIAGSVAVPGLMDRLPGTTLNHEQALSSDREAVQGDIANEQKQAQTNDLNAKPALRQAQNDLKQNQQQQTSDLNSRKLEETTQHHQQQIGEQLKQHGYTLDETDPSGQKIRPLRYEEMSQDQQAVHDLKISQQELADGHAALVKAQKDNIPVQVQMAKQRIATAQRNSSTAAQRLGLSREQFDMRSRGTDTSGNPLPGAMIDDEGNSIGTAFQQNVRPTGQERNKADLASSAHDQIADMKSIVTKRPDVFDPLNGRKTDFTVWLGSQDPDAQRFRAARTIAGDHLAGVFGGRSEAALSALDKAIGQFKDNPKAVLAGLDQLDKANDRFVKKGTVRTAGSAADKQQPGNTAPPASGGNRPTITTQDQFDALPRGAEYLNNGKPHRKP